MDALNQLTIRAAADGLREGKFTSLDLTEACLERMRSVDGQVHAVLEPLEAIAREAAKASDARRAAGGALGPLDGIPLMVKDNMQMNGSHTTAGSKILEDYESPFDATAVARLKAAGAVILGK